MSVFNAATWWYQNDFRLLQRATDFVAKTDSVQAALEQNGIKRTQLQALLNTARCCPAKELRQFIGRRKERRDKAGDELEAGFWEAVERELANLLNEELHGLEQEGSLEKGEREEIKTLIGRRYIEHLVSHCLYCHAINT